MKLNSVFQTAQVPIPDRSGFDLSREHLLTTKVGTLTPVECIEVMPNDTISMGAMAKTTFPPFAVPFMGRIDACMEAFFVPMRILWKGWQNFITQNAGINQAVAGIPAGIVPIQVPVIDLSDTNNSPYLGAGTLADYLGFKSSGTSSWSISALKHLAYHKVCDYWYRDQNNVKPFFAKNVNTTLASTGNLLPHFIDSVTSSTNTPVLSLAPTSPNATYDKIYDETIGLGDLRQRCWAKDYFTTMTTRPQAGDAAQVTFSTAGATGNFTIADLRAANALQKWLERNGIASTDYGSQILAHYGVTPPDSVIDKPLLLGASRDSVYVGSVENNSNAESSGAGSGNPFGEYLGTAAGFGSGLNKGSLVNNFHAKEHGFIMVMYSIVPHAYYESGCERELRHTSVGDFAWPEYAHIGDQTVFAEELWTGAASSTPIGYNQRYSEYKHRQDKISGLLRDGQNLDVYALKRGFTSTPALGKAFLEIPTNYLDQVSNASLLISGFGAMVDIFFDTKAIRLLPQYSLPSL